MHFCEESLSLEGRARTECPLHYQIYMRWEPALCGLTSFPSGNPEGHLCLQENGGPVQHRQRNLRPPAHGMLQSHICAWSPCTHHADSHFQN